MSAFSQKSKPNPSASFSKDQAKDSFFGVQAKLNIGKSNDKYEVEADRAADKVVSKKQDKAAESFFSPSPVIQKKLVAQVRKQDEQHQEIQQKTLADTITPTARIMSKEKASALKQPLIQKKKEEEIRKKDITEKTKVQEAKAENTKAKEKATTSKQPLVQKKKEEEIQKKSIPEKTEASPKTDPAKTGNTTPKEKSHAPKPLIQKKKEEETQAKEEEEIQAKEEESELRMSACADADPADATGLESQLNSSKGGGSLLSGKVKNEMESGFGADFGNIRIHNDSNAVQMNRQLGSQAFATGNNIYFNQGKYNPDSSQGKHLLAHELTHTVQQGAAGIRKKTEVTPAPEMIQGSFLDVVPDWVINQARHIPGYTLFTVVAAYDPLRRIAVTRTPVNLLEGLMGLVPFGTAIFDKLQEYGILQRVFDWVQGRLSEIGLTADSILALVEEVWNEVSFPYTDMIDLITEKFQEVLRRITSFVSATTDQVIAWIKEALIGVAEPLLAQNKAWALIKKIIKYDPLRDEQVSATTVEILEDFLILIGKQTELDQMREKGTLQKTADWLDTQTGTFTSLLGELRRLITAAWDAVQPSNLANLADSLATLATQAGELLQRVWEFARGVALKVLELVKESLLGWMSSQASGVRGYSLIKVIIGKDPFTNQTVERSVPNLIRGFMSLMDGGEAQYAQMVESGAIARIAGQIQAAVATLNMTPEYIVQLFTDLWNSLSIDDLVHPIDAFARIIEQFGEPIGRLIAFVAEIIRIVIVAIMQIMNFPFDLIGNIITRAMQAIEDIKKDPIGFLKNILRALKQGFTQFFSNIVTHLVGGITGWLMSELGDANVPAPQDFTLRGIITWVLQVLNISMERIWEKLAAHPRVGAARVARIRGAINTLEGIWTFIKDVQERGMAAIWDKIQEQLSNLWNTVLDAVKNFIMERIVNRITARLLSMLDPTGIMAVINGAMALYSAIQSFIKYFREMLEVVNSFVNGVADIAKGNVSTAANYLERTMGRAMPIVIGFLANQVGLSGIGRRIAQIIASVRELVDRALTWLVNKAVDTGMNILDRVMGRNAPGATPSGAMASALGEIDTETRKEQDGGEVTPDEAQAIKNKVNRDQSSVINISSVTDGGKTWDYHYVQKAEEIKKEPKKPLPKTVVTPGAIVDGKATKSTARPLTNIPGVPPGSDPKEDIKGWSHVRSFDVGEDKHGTRRVMNWVKFHLVHNLGMSGPGLKWNLVPAAGKDNADFYNAFELPMLERLEKNPEGIFSYEVSVEKYRDAEGTSYMNDFPELLKIKADELNDDLSVKTPLYNLPFEFQIKPKPSRGPGDAISILLTNTGRENLLRVCSGGLSDHGARAIIALNVTNVADLSLEMIKPARDWSSYMDRLGYLKAIKNSIGNYPKTGSVEFRVFLFSENEAATTKDDLQKEIVKHETFAANFSTGVLKAEFDNLETRMPSGEIKRNVNANLRIRIFTFNDYLAGRKVPHPSVLKTIIEHLRTL